MLKILGVDASSISGSWNPIHLPGTIFILIVTITSCCLPRSNGFVFQNPGFPSLPEFMPPPFPDPSRPVNFVAHYNTFFPLESQVRPQISYPSPHIASASQRGGFTYRKPLFSAPSKSGDYLAYESTAEYPVRSPPMDPRPVSRKYPKPRPSKDSYYSKPKYYSKSGPVRTPYGTPYQILKNEVYYKSSFQPTKDSIERDAQSSSNVYRKPKMIKHSRILKPITRGVLGPSPTPFLVKQEYIKVTYEPTPATFSKPIKPSTEPSVDIAFKPRLPEPSSKYEYKTFKEDNAQFLTDFKPMTGFMPPKVKTVSNTYTYKVQKKFPTPVEYQTLNEPSSGPSPQPPSSAVVDYDTDIITIDDVPKSYQAPKGNSFTKEVGSTLTFSEDRPSVKGKIFDDVVYGAPQSISASEPYSKPSSRGVRRRGKHMRLETLSNEENKESWKRVRLASEILLNNDKPKETSANLDYPVSTLGNKEKESIGPELVTPLVTYNYSTTTQGGNPSRVQSYFYMQNSPSLVSKPLEDETPARSPSKAIKADVVAEEVKPKTEKVAAQDNDWIVAKPIFRQTVTKKMQIKEEADEAEEGDIRPVYRGKKTSSLPPTRNESTKKYSNSPSSESSVKVDSKKPELARKEPKKVGDNVFRRIQAKKEEQTKDKRTAEEPLLRYSLRDEKRNESLTTKSSAKSFGSNLDSRKALKKEEENDEEGKGKDEEEEKDEWSPNRRPKFERTKFGRNTKKVDNSNEKDETKYFSSVQSSPLKSNFSCLGKSEGYYADTDYDCQVYHHCSKYAQKIFLCPNGTLFNEANSACEDSNEVKCDLGRSGLHYRGSTEKQSQGNTDGGTEDEDEEDDGLSYLREEEEDYEDGKKESETKKSM